MPKPLVINPDRLFSADPAQRAVARELYAQVKDCPILSPHGHTDPAWFADNDSFGNATELFLA
ncbi:MAG: glucuronate isomerase, partial [Asticcacaulis sp.]